MQWKPIGDKIIIRKAAESEEVTTSGIVLVGKDPNDHYIEAEVVAVGSGKWENGHLVPMEIAVGDTVMYHKHYGTDISPTNPSDKASYTVLHQDDITGVINQ